MSRRRVLPNDETLETLLIAYRISEIARWFKVDRTSVKEHARRLGLPPRKPGGATRSLKDREPPEYLVIPR